jgi:hypothetical protein
MKELEKLGIVHRDLALRNCLVGETEGQLVIKVAGKDCLLFCQSREP